MNRPDLQELSRRIAIDDDTRSFKDLYNDMYFDLVAFSKSIVSQQQDAEDIVIEVFERLWQNRKNLSNIKNLAAYLYTATKYGSLNCIKARNKSGDIEDLSATINYHYPTPETQLISKEHIRQIELAVGTLPPRTRLVFFLIKEKKLTSNEVALLLNLSVRTVETQVYHAVRKIALALDHINELRREVPRLKKKV